MEHSPFGTHAPSLCYQPQEIQHRVGVVACTADRICFGEGFMLMRLPSKPQHASTRHIVGLDPLTLTPKTLGVCHCAECQALLLLLQPAQKNKQAEGLCCTQLSNPFILHPARRGDWTAYHLCRASWTAHTIQQSVEVL
jgi:hypothetical protein